MLVMFILCTIVAAQQTIYHTAEERVFRQGMELYQNGKYSAAQQIFDKYAEDHAGDNSDQISNCDFYAAMCAVKLFNNDAESRVVIFLNNNPENPHRNEAMFNLAAYFFQRKSYSIFC